MVSTQSRESPYGHQAGIIAYVVADHGEDVGAVFEFLVLVFAGENSYDARAKTVEKTDFQIEYVPAMRKDLYDPSGGGAVAVKIDEAVQMNLAVDCSSDS
jgi:hypothetical protein